MSAGASASASLTPELEAIAEDLCRTISEIHAHGWCLGTSGNFSVTVSRRPTRILITSSGRDKRRLTPGELLIVDGDGQPISDGSPPPSAETLLHCAIVERTGAAATLHTHSVAATLVGRHSLPAGGLSWSGYEMLKGLRGVATHEAEVFVPVLPNSQDMAAFSRDVEALLDERPEIRGFLIAGHGLYTWGASLSEAQRHVEIFEFLLECTARQLAYPAL